MGVSFAFSKPLVRGVRLTCPMCRDSTVFTEAQIKAAGGQVICGNHRAWVEMVDLVGLMEIWGRSAPVEEDVELVEEAA